MSGYFNKHGDYIQGPVFDIDQQRHAEAWAQAVERTGQNGSLARQTQTGNHDYFQRQLIGALAERTVLDTFAGSELNPDPRGYWDIIYRGVRLEVKGSIQTSDTSTPTRTIGTRSRNTGFASSSISSKPSRLWSAMSRGMNSSPRRTSFSGTTGTRTNGERDTGSRTPTFNPTGRVLSSSDP